MPESFQTLSPIDGRVYVERPFASDAEIEGALSRARRALAGWRRTPLAERIVLLRAMTEHLLGQKEALAEELTRQMGRPLSQTPWEIAGYAARASAMLDLGTFPVTSAMKHVGKLTAAANPTVGAVSYLEGYETPGVMPEHMRANLMPTCLHEYTALPTPADFAGFQPAVRGLLGELRRHVAAVQLELLRCVR